MPPLCPHSLPEKLRGWVIKAAKIPVTHTPDVVIVEVRSPAWRSA